MMGNTMDNNNTTSDENGPQENPNQTASRIRSNVYRVLMDRENDASGTQLNPEGTSQSSPPQELPEEKDSSSDDYEEESSDGQEDQMVALQIISQLLGIRPDMRHRAAEPPSPDPSVRPKPTPMDPSCDLYKEMNGFKVAKCTSNIVDRTRSLHYLRDRISHSEQLNVSSQFLPEHCCTADSFETRVFCGQYSNDGNLFVCAPQDGNIQLYNTEGSQFSHYKSVETRDVGWSVLSTSFSPDQNWFTYSTWSPYIHMCNVYGDDEHHYSLDLHPEEGRHFCAFAAIFSPDNREILAATSDGKLYIYDRDRNHRTVAINTHQDDANGLAFADTSGDLLFTTGDDGLCKAWDRRTLNTDHPNPVGIFSGHKDGITHVDSRNDGRYLVTNSKDQSIKLWDVRKFSNTTGIEATLSKVSGQIWDYRWEEPPRRTRSECSKKLNGDTSVMTYTGHSVKNTLIRCRFSPSFTTGQRYIYTGCANGRVIIYDVISGEIISRLHSNRSRFCVRDVSWNPYQVGVLTASVWDGTLQLWSPEQRSDYVDTLGCERQFQFW